MRQRLLITAVALLAIASRAAAQDYHGGGGGGSGGGSVSSVGLTLPNFITVAGSPITSSGTLAGTLATQAAHTFFMGPTSGADAAPGFRLMVAGDLVNGLANFIVSGPTAARTFTYPDANATIFTSAGMVPVANGGTNIASFTIGDIMQATGATTIGKLAAVATGNVMLSGGVATANTWGKVGLTTHVTGTLGAGNGGTNSPFFQVAGPTALHTYTFPTGDATIADLNSAQQFANKSFSELVGNGVKCLQTDNVGHVSPATNACGTGGGSGTVTSVNVTVPSWLAASGGPVTGSGTIAIGAATTQAHKFLRGPVSGADAAIAPGVLDPTDFPSVPETSATTGFTADYNNQYGANFASAGAIALPPTSGHAYDTVVVRLDRASANVTIDPNASEPIDGKPSIVMVGGESGVFQVNSAGTGWNILSYTPVATRCVLYFATTQSISTHTKINLNTSVRDVGGMADTTNHVCVVRRTADYHVAGFANFSSNTLATYVSVVIGLGASGANSWIAPSTRYEPANGTIGMPVSGMLVNASVGDQIGLYADASTSLALIQGGTYGDGTAGSYLIVEEVLR